MSRFKRRERKEPGGAPEEKKAQPRRRRALSGMAKPKSGNNTSHGGFGVLKRLQEGGLDGRSKEAKAIRLFEKSIIESLGGPENVSGFQRSLLDRGAEILVVLNAMAGHVAREGVIDENGNLEKCLKHSFLSFSNSFRRILESIYTISMKPLPYAKPKLLPDRPVVELDNSDSRAAHVLEILMNTGAVTRLLDMEKTNSAASQQTIEMKRVRNYGPKNG